jgi:hypothetical protein
MIVKERPRVLLRVLAAFLNTLSPPAGRGWPDLLAALASQPLPASGER